MKIVFSYLDWGYTKYLDFNLVKISHNIIKKHGYQTILYVNQKNYSKFKNIKYNEIRIFDDKLIEIIPKNIWCLGKLIAFRETKEPFCHIDFDLFMVNDILTSFIQKDFFCFHREMWRPIEHFKDLYTNALINLDLVKNINKLITHNCAIMGGQNFKIINNAADIVLDYVIKEKNFLYEFSEKLINKKVDGIWPTPVFIEQILFVNICKYLLNLEKVPVIFSSDKEEHENSVEFVYEKMFEKQVYHLWGEKNDIMNKLYQKKLL